MAGYEKRASITGDAALTIMTRVFEKANAMDKAVYIAVTDGTGGLVGLLGHEKCPVMCRKVAQDKAYTAFATRMKTAQWKAYVYSCGEDDKYVMLNQPGFIAASGGAPILVDGIVAGGIGVSGAGQQEDEDLADYGASLIGAM
ncbi:MAG TPA: heme-binding protein [Alphaproteobacteria bacterium]|nr:heme-binding protein [Alphaproteobacteria bacterium]